MHINAKSKRKNKDESAILTKKLIGKAKPSTPPAIIAIEIVDPNENKTSKNSKRTIEQALGYGYNQPSQPRYEVYKYQKDIPPYQGNFNLFSGNIKSHNFDIQKSVSYQLNQHYRPGTTLYSTVNSHGEIGGLSANVPQQNRYNNEPHVPVVILRVYPNQLADPSAVLHPNLPQSHPLASAINSIDIQSLLANYVQKLAVPQQIPQQYNYPENSFQYYQQPSLSHQQPYYQSYQQQQPQSHGLLSYENYPRETHTRVIFKDNKNQQDVIRKENEVKTIKIHLPEHHSFSSVQVQTPDMQYGYTTHDNSEQNYYYQQPEEQNYNYEQSPNQEQYNEPAQNEEQYNVQPQNEEQYNYQQAKQEQGYNYQDQSYYKTYQAHPQQEYLSQNYGYQAPTADLSINQQVEEQGQQQHREESETEKPYNYHAHQKRSKKTKYSTKTRTQDANIKLNPVKA